MTTTTTTTTTTTNAIELSEQQEAAAKAVSEWLQEWQYDSRENPRPYFTLCGYAGTGKTTITKTIVDRTGRTPAWMAYTGKAALIMRKYGGVPARTIHSTIYRLVSVPDSVFKELYDKRDKASGEKERKEIQDQIKDLMKPRFERKEYDDAFPNGEDLIVLDECSMVDDELLGDLRSYGIPILALGDPGQLPPIAGTGALFSKKPDVVLTEIRRQALGNPIIEWSMKARQKMPLMYTQLGEDGKAQRLPRKVLSEKAFWDIYADSDVCICWRNKTRQALNMTWRRRLGRTGVWPVPGDRLIITKNDRELGVFNGQFADVLSVGELYDKYISITVLPEGEGQKETELKVLRACFEEYTNGPTVWDQLRAWDYPGRQQADYGYALTCHKAQGSQWEKVLVLDDNVLNWPDKYSERARWLYTAITRASEKLTIVTGRVEL